MPKLDLEAIVSDPEFATFSEQERAKIVRDAQARARSKPPLVTKAAADPAPARPMVPTPRPAPGPMPMGGQPLVVKSAANLARRSVPPATVMDELKAVLPQNPGEAPADIAARAKRLASPPIPGTLASLARSARESVTDNLLGGVTGGMMLAPVYQRALDEATPRDILDRPTYQPRTLVTKDAADPTPIRDMVDGITGPIADVVREPSRLLPSSPGFAEGLTAAAVGTPTAIFGDPAGDLLLGGGAAAARPVVKAGAKLAGKALRGADAVAGDFAGRLGIAAAPAITKAAPYVRKATDAAAEVGGIVRDAANGNLAGGPVRKATMADDTLPLPDVPTLLAQADALQKAAPIKPSSKGARSGSIRVGRQPSDGWTPAQDEMNRTIERKIRELSKERRQAEIDSNPERVALIDAEVQSLDDARVVIPKSGNGPVVTIRDLRDQHAEAMAAGDEATATRLMRQIGRMRATNYFHELKYDFLGQESRDKFIALTEQKVAELRAAGRDPRTPVPSGTVLREAQDILPFKLEQMARKGLAKGESLTAAEYEAAKNYMQQLIEESVTVERRVNAIRAAQNGGPIPNDINGNPLDPARLGEALTVESTRQMQLEKDASGLLEIVTQSRSQKGRDLAYLKMVAQQGWDTGYWTSRAHRTSGGVATNQQIGEINGIVVRGQQAEAAGDAAGQRQARIDLAQAMGRLTVTPWMDALMMARKAGLLSGFKTVARNNASNALNLTLEEGVNLIGVVPDAFLSMMTGRRTMFAREAANIGRAFNEVVTRGIPEARETMLFGMPLDQLAALDIPSEINTPSRAFNAYVNWIMRFQGAQDRVFKAYALRRSLDAQARALTLETVNAPGPRVPPAQREAMIRNLADNPTEAMMYEAIADAEFATFQNETVISKAITALKRGAKQHDTETGSTTGAWFNRGFDLFMPFTKTPASVGARVLDFTVGTGTAQAAGRRGARLRQERRTAANAGRSPSSVEWMTREEQKAISKGLSRQAIGGTLIWLGQRLYEEGRLSGTEQLDRREENNAAGRMGNAIKIGDEWVPLNPFSPVGNILTLGATMARDGQGSGGVEETARIVAQLTALMLDQPFTQGAKQFVEVAGDTGGRKMARFIGGTAGSIVPSFVNEISMALDPSEDARAVDYGDALTASLQSIQARTPFRQMLPTRYTGLGDPQDANTGLRAFAAGAGRFARENYDPIVREVLETGASVPRLTDGLSIQRGAPEVPLTLEEQMRLLQAQGGAARQGAMMALSTPGYAGQNSEEQREALDAAIRAQARAAKGRFLTPEMEAILRDRLANATEAQRARRGQRRAVVGPIQEAR